MTNERLDEISGEQMLKLIEALENIESQTQVELDFEGQAIHERVIVFSCAVTESIAVERTSFRNPREATEKQNVKTKLYITREPVACAAITSLGDQIPGSYEVIYTWSVGDKPSAGLRLSRAQEAQMEAAFSDERKRADAKKHARIHDLISKL